MGWEDTYRVCLCLYYEEEAGAEKLNSFLLVSDEIAGFGGTDPPIRIRIRTTTLLKLMK
jgi:hypothetical protein